MGTVVLIKGETATGVVRLTNPTSRTYSYSINIKIYFPEIDSSICETGYTTAQNCAGGAYIDIPFSLVIPSGIYSDKHCKTQIFVKANGVYLTTYEDISQPIVVTGWARGDINGDGEIDVADRSLIGQISLGLSPSPNIITMGNEALQRSTYVDLSLYTFIDLLNPVLSKGIINTIEIKSDYQCDWDSTDAKVGTFYRDISHPEGQYFICRNWATLPTFTSYADKVVVNGLSLNVEVGDFIGIYAGTYPYTLAVVRADGINVNRGFAFVNFDGAVQGMSYLYTLDSYKLSIKGIGTASNNFPVTCRKRADVNKDGIVNAQDAVAIQLLPDYNIGGVMNMTVQNIVTSSRLSNTVYQNTSGKPMMVTLVVTMRTNAQSSGSYTQYVPSILSDSNNPPTTIILPASIGAAIVGNISVDIPMTFIVLPGNYYKLKYDYVSYNSTTGVTTTTNPTIAVSKWVEWY